MDNETTGIRLRRHLTIRQQQRLVIAVFLLVPLTLMVVFTVIPFCQMVSFSLYDMKYIGARRFVGMKNYIAVFQREDVREAFSLSIFYLVAGLLQMALALFFAALLTTNVKLGGVYQGMLFLPYMISGIAIGFVFKYFYARGLVLDTVLSKLGFNMENLPKWLMERPLNNIVLSATSVWRYLGYNVVIYHGAMMAIDPNLFEAATIDGANSVQKFFHVTVPGIRTFLSLALILTVSGSLSVFEQPYVITNGNFGTATLLFVIHNIAHSKQKVGLASAISIVQLLLIMTVTIGARVTLNRFGKHEGRLQR